ncbi:unnamed protein product [Euphydryas editha]|uniref:Uncharacterized protein n=1 Tax=Euphydryas editha TaxID=104508 RepID=A0AAU9VA82_EUPED|nr:unnamed protein product [Euphydryas editha]
MWMGFIGLFESLVDSREDLGPSQKLAYLLSVLDGEARGLVQHLPISDGSYEVARSLLTKRYHNQRCLADAHIDQIMDLPVVSSAAQLRTELLNPFLIATNALNRLGLPVAQWSYLLVRIVLKRLPVSLRARFEQGHARDEASPLPTFDQLLTFLEDKCRMGDVMVADTPVEPSGPRPTNQRRTAQIAPKGKAVPLTPICCRADCATGLPIFLESGSPPPRSADCAAVDRRHGSARSPTGGYESGRRVESRTFVSRSPPQSPHGQSRSPPVVHHDYRGARPARLPSPPLAERPRLESRNPRYGRSWRYEQPTMARSSRH